MRKSLKRGGAARGSSPATMACAIPSGPCSASRIHTTRCGALGALGLEIMVASSAAASSRSMGPGWAITASASAVQLCSQTRSDA